MSIIYVYTNVVVGIASIIIIAHLQRWRYFQTFAFLLHAISPALPYDMKSFIMSFYILTFNLSGIPQLQTVPEKCRHFIHPALILCLIITYLYLIFTSLIVKFTLSMSYLAYTLGDLATSECKFLYIGKPQVCNSVFTSVPILYPVTIQPQQNQFKYKKLKLNNRA